MQLASGPLDLQYNQLILKRIVRTIERKVDPGTEGEHVIEESEHIDKEIPDSDTLGGGRPTLNKIDYTRDVGGCFYVSRDLKAKHRELCGRLGANMFNVFVDNGNSMDTCFHFVARFEEGGLDMSIKIYWKNLQRFQSAGVCKFLGMNTRGLFCPDVRMSQALNEARNVGLTRYEITYTAKTLKA